MAASMLLVCLRRRPTPTPVRGVPDLGADRCIGPGRPARRRHGERSRSAGRVEGEFEIELYAIGGADRDRELRLPGPMRLLQRREVPPRPRRFRHPGRRSRDARQRRRLRRHRHRRPGVFLRDRAAAPRTSDTTRTASRWRTTRWPTAASSSSRSPTSIGGLARTLHDLRRGGRAGPMSSTPSPRCPSTTRGSACRSHRSMIDRIEIGPAPESAPIRRLRRPRRRSNRFAL